LTFVAYALQYKHTKRDIAMEITKVKQHFIDFGESSLEQFIANYRATPLRSLRKDMVEALDMQTNVEWLKARQGHITASNASKFLTGGRTKGELFGDTAKAVVNQYLDEKTDPCCDDLASRVETYQMKMGLVGEKRALQLFQEQTGLVASDEIGFISQNIDGIDFGCSPDAVIYNKDGSIDAIIEIKTRSGAEFRAERDKLGNKATVEQMQLAMLVADCPRAYLVMYDIANDKVQFIAWTRGLAFKRRLCEQIKIAKNYIEEQKELDKYTNLKEHLLVEDIYQE